MTQFAVLLIIGLLSGVISGMGIGGGAILIPALVLFVNVDQHIAQSVNLIFFIPTSIISLFVHIKNKRVDIKTALPIIATGLAGAFAGSKLAAATEGEVLGKWFGIFLLAMGGYEFFRKGSKKDKHHKDK
jgi:uncharacterized membrane protein YfcA